MGRGRTVRSVLTPHQCLFGHAHCPAPHQRSTGVAYLHADQGQQAERECELGDHCGRTGGTGICWGGEGGSGCCNLVREWCLMGVGSGI